MVVADNRIVGPSAFVSVLNQVRFVAAAAAVINRLSIWSNQLDCARLCVQSEQNKQQNYQLAQEKQSGPILGPNPSDP